MAFANFQNKSKTAENISHSSRRLSYSRAGNNSPTNKTTNATEEHEGTQGTYDWVGGWVVPKQEKCPYPCELRAEQNIHTKNNVAKT